VAHYYDRKGRPLDMEGWMPLFGDRDYCRVALDDLVLDGVEVHVSTVWLGLDHSWGYGPPLFFETMIFGLKGELADYQERYSSEDAARKGHERAVNLLVTGQVRALLRG
jgi:hypothetical protein